MSIFIMLSFLWLVGVEKPTELAMLTLAVSCCADALWFNIIFNRKKRK